eukprot:CAMPEP_0177696130 /NCGR_PEP_ID=MMETSP0484_2-20121128/3817_1 /TAXON_ID=354590 /ORGANISM="Rhodomonas lens, Strain RHODO" /LENGTH=227 /DNA_ID=CAMNT_0019207083 /DNA_START=102 /DNA_END=782 /DNA_ORIENTATION=-
MKKTSTVKKISTAIKGKSEPSIMEMEDRLETLKQQMAVERAKREQLLKRNGTGSFWLNGREGALRGPQVKEFVKKGVKESKARKAIIQSNNNDAEEQGRISPASGASTERSSSVGENNNAENKSPKQHGDIAPSKESNLKSNKAPSVQGMYQSSRPTTPPSSGPEEFRVVGAGKEVQRPSTASVMDDGGCQTERPSRKEWVVKAMPRPQSARPMTYFEKIMAARKQQ